MRSRTAARPRQCGDRNELLTLNVVPFAAQEAKPPVILHAFNPADWEGKTAPPRLWIVLDYIPAGTVTLLYADGGTGKSYFKLQLAVARALSGLCSNLAAPSSCPQKTTLTRCGGESKECYHSSAPAWQHSACRSCRRKFNPRLAHERHNRADANICRARRLHCRKAPLGIPPNSVTVDNALAVEPQQVVLGKGESADWRF